MNYSVDCVYVVWHVFNHIGHLLSAHLCHMLTGIFFQRFLLNGYFKCTCSVFAHKPEFGCNYIVSPLFGDTRDHSRCPTGGTHFIMKCKCVLSIGV